jgi:uncharacterized membrane protein
MSVTRRDSGAYVCAALYAAAGFVLVDQASDLAASLYPFQPGQVNWRFAAFGLLTGRLTTLVLLDAVLLIAALGRGDSRFIRFLALLHVPVALFFLVSLPLFALDALELYRAVKAEASRGLLLASARATVMAMTALVFSVCVVVAGLRATRRSASGSRTQAPVVVGTGS